MCGFSRDLQDSVKRLSDFCLGPLRNPMGFRVGELWVFTAEEVSMREASGSSHHPPTISPCRQVPPSAAATVPPSAAPTHTKIPVDLYGLIGAQCVAFLLGLGGMGILLLVGGGGDFQLFAFFWCGVERMKSCDSLFWYPSSISRIQESSSVPSCRFLKGIQVAPPPSHFWNPPGEFLLVWLGFSFAYFL